MHTAKVKHNLQSPNFKKVLFCLHESKTEFRIYVEAFIDRHCDKKYAQVMPLSYRSIVIPLDGDVKFILFDECPTCSDSKGIENEIENLPEEVKVVRTITYSAKRDLPFAGITFYEWKTFHLINAYRCPANLTLRYTKIRRQNVFSDNNSHHYFSLSNSAPHFVDEKSIQILAYTTDITECELPEQQFVGESLLVVIIDLDDTDDDDTDDDDTDDDDIDLKVVTMFGDSANYCFPYGTANKRCHFPMELLNFTGVQYHTVVIIVGANGRRKLNCTDMEILYHAVSRSLRRLIVLCHYTRYYWISRVLSLDNLDLSVFMKLNRGERLSDHDMRLIETKADLKEALQILIIRKEYTQLNRLLKYVLSSNLNQYLEEVMVRSLSPRMLNLEEPDLLGLLESVLLPEGNFEFFGYFFTHSLKGDISEMRNIFLTLQPQNHTKWEDFISQQLSRGESHRVLSLMDASAALMDPKLFSAALTVFKTAIHTITEILLEILSKKPNRLKRYLHRFTKKADGSASTKRCKLASTNVLLAMKMNILTPFKHY